RALLSEPAAREGRTDASHRCPRPFRRHHDGRRANMLPQTAMQAVRAAALVAMAASYCPPCRAEVPVLGRALRRWRGAGLRVLAVMVDVEDPGDVRALARAWGIDYEVYAVAPGQEHALEALLDRGVPSA